MTRADPSIFTDSTAPNRAGTLKDRSSLHSSIRPPHFIRLQLPQSYKTPPRPKNSTHGCVSRYSWYIDASDAMLTASASQVLRHSTLVILQILSHVSNAPNLTRCSRCFDDRCKRPCELQSHSLWRCILLVNPVHLLWWQLSLPDSGW